MKAEMWLISVGRRRLLVCPRTSRRLETTSTALYLRLQRWSVSVFFYSFYAQQQELL